jgi:hypothetical protein
MDNTSSKLPKHHHQIHFPAPTDWSSRIPTSLDQKLLLYIFRHRIPSSGISGAKIPVKLPLSSPQKLEDKHEDEGEEAGAEEGP